MKVLIVAGGHDHDIRGGTIAIHGLARALRDRGHELTILHAAKPADRVQIDGIELHYTGVMHKSIYPLLFPLRPFGRYDVIHAHDWSGAYFALIHRLRPLWLSSRLR